MKFTSSFHVLVFLMVLLTFSTSFITFAQPEPSRQVEQPKQAGTTAEQNTQVPQIVDPAESLKMQAIEDAEKDVEAYINKPMWFIIGCMFPAIGLVGPYVYKPSPPAGALIGKSPAYVAYYTDAYKSKMEKQQFRYALNGCITAGIVNCLGFGCLTISGAFTGI